MKKIITLIHAFLFIPFLKIHANEFNLIPGMPERQFSDLFWSIRNVASWLFAFLILASVIGVVISGYMFITSGGDSGKVASARQMLIYSLVGVLVGGFALALVSFVGGVSVPAPQAIL